MSNIFLSEQAKKDLDKIAKSEKEKIKRNLLQLEHDTKNGKALIGKLKGLYSLKAWPYRIIYEFNKNSNSINVHKIQHRQGVYKK